MRGWRESEMWEGRMEGERRRNGEKDRGIEERERERVVVVVEEGPSEAETTENEKD